MCVIQIQIHAIHKIFKCIYKNINIIYLYIYFGLYCKKKKNIVEFMWASHKKDQKITLSNDFCI